MNDFSVDYIMNIVSYLFFKFFEEERLRTIFIICLSLLITVFQTNIISYVTAIIIQGVEKRAYKDVFHFFKIFLGISAVYLFIYKLYKDQQNYILSKMPQWIKKEIMEVILKVNNVNISNANFIEFITPITRIAMSCYVLFFDVVSVLLPTTSFILIISLYFFYKNIFFGLSFFIANLLIIVYCWFYWQNMLEEKAKHENKINENEKIIIDILNNIDKVIYRGEIDNEIQSFSNKTSEGIEVAKIYTTYITGHTFLITAFIYLIIFASIYYLIILTEQRKIDTTIFITFFTILLLYRDTILHVVHNIPDYIEFIGKLDYIMIEFNKMLGEKVDTEDILEQKYKIVDLPFDNIDFKNVVFMYPGTDKKIFDGLNMSLDLRGRGGKIFGINGVSGKGKSSFVKLILRLYDCNDGEISVDGVDIKTIDPNYIRNNITYINQNSALFDKKVIENMMYGCKNEDKCSVLLKEILEYSKIQNLFKNIDIHETDAGSLGSALSGGQKQIVNVISGLVNPSKILILDEPTNALDLSLKKELINIISNFKDRKKAIIIISHDRDMDPLFDKILKF